MPTNLKFTTSKKIRFLVACLFVSSLLFLFLFHSSESVLITPSEDGAIDGIEIMLSSDEIVFSEQKEEQTTSGPSDDDKVLGEKDEHVVPQVDIAPVDAMDDGMETHDRPIPPLREEEEAMDLPPKTVAKALPRSKKPSSAGKERILYVFISIGIHQNRNDIIRQNFEYLVVQNQNNPKYHIDCILFGYGGDETQPDWVKKLQEEENPVCDFIKVYQQRYVYFLKAIPPLLVEEGQYKYLTFVLDDVVHYPPMGKFDFTLYYDIIFQNNLGFISPSVLGSYWTNDIGPRPVNETLHEVGRVAKMIELQSSTFRPDVWRCMYDLLDTEYPSGWGIDLWFYDYCIAEKRVENATMAIIDIMHVQHNPYNFESSHVGIDHHEQTNHWARVKGIELKETFPEQNLGMIYYYHPKSSNP